VSTAQLPVRERPTFGTTLHQCLIRLVTERLYVLCLRPTTCNFKLSSDTVQNEMSQLFAVRLLLSQLLSPVVSMMFHNVTYQLWTTFSGYFHDIFINSCCAELCHSHLVCRALIRICKSYINLGSKAWVRYIEISTIKVLDCDMLYSEFSVNRLLV